MTRKSKFPPQKSPKPEDGETLPEEGASVSEQQEASPESLAEQEKLLAETRRALIEEQKLAEPKMGALKKVTERFMSGRKKAKEAAGESLPEPAPRSEEPGEAPLLAESSDQEIHPTDEPLDVETQALLESLEKAQVETELMEQLEAEQARPLVTEPTKADVLEIAHQVLSTKPEHDTAAEIHDVRDIVLDGYEEATQEKEPAAGPTLDDKLDALLNRFNYQNLIRLAIVAVMIVAILATILIVPNLLRAQSALFAPPTATPTMIVPTAPLPTPWQVRLPGGWVFALDSSGIVEGKWAPTGPEWLEGTEICKWISLPYSAQLDAVLRTLKQGDRIDLIMTNSDRWMYYVRSVQDVPAAQMSNMDKNYPSMLLILTNPESDTRLVILAAP